MSLRISAALRLDRCRFPSALNLRSLARGAMTPTCSHIRDSLLQALTFSGFSSMSGPTTKPTKSLKKPIAPDVWDLSSTPLFFWGELQVQRPSLTPIDPQDSLGTRQYDRFFPGAWLQHDVPRVQVLRRQGSIGQSDRGVPRVHD